MKMFDIYYANLSKNAVKSEQGGVRPVLIIQNDVGNRFSPTLIVLPVTSEIKKENMPTHCVIHKSLDNGLDRDSMVLAEQIRVIDKSRVLDYVGHVNSSVDQNNILNAYLANITGKKTYSSVWSKIVNMIFKLVKEGEHGYAA